MKNPFFLLSTFIFLIMLVETNSTYIDKKKTVYNIVQLESDKYKECMNLFNNTQNYPSFSVSSKKSKQYI